MSSTAGEPRAESNAPVCARCGTPAAGNAYCPVCGFNLKAAATSLPTRQDWEAGKTANAEASAEGEDNTGLVAMVWLLSVAWLAFFYFFVVGKWGYELGDRGIGDYRPIDWLIGIITLPALLIAFGVVIALFSDSSKPVKGAPRTRTAIPSSTKQAVWARDQGRCVYCGSDYDLQYDHIIPVSKGGGNSAANVQVLCGPCNRSKSARIE